MTSKSCPKGTKKVGKTCIKLETFNLEPHIKKFSKQELIRCVLYLSERYKSLDKKLTNKQILIQLEYIQPLKMGS